MRIFFTIIFLYFFLPGHAQFSGLLINEFSQGDAGSKEYIEILVAGKRTCKDSTADIRNWIIDDQNGWYGTTSLTPGHYRFKDISAWSAVPIGAIILLYNSAANSKNNSITLADDPTDANNDLVYIVPINSSAYMEENDNEPSATTGVNYIYPAAGTATGYTGSSNTWVSHIGLNNGSDVISTISPQNRTAAYFSIGNGYTPPPGFKIPAVSVAAVNANNNCYLSNASYNTAGSWAISTGAANETPGLPNGGSNTTWILAMRKTPLAQITYTTACSDGPYNFFNQVIQNTGAYTVLTNNTNGCVDTNYLYVVLKGSDVKDTTACDSLLYKGIVYKSNTTITDIIKSSLIDCDSIVRTLHINIRYSSSSQTDVCRGIGQSYIFNGNTYTASGSYADTFVNTAGCTSIARLFLVITARQSQNIAGCGVVNYKGKNYTASTIVYDTILSRVLGCDSIIKEVSITVNHEKSSFITACMNEGDSYNFNSQPVTVAGYYTVVLLTTAGCDSTVSLYINFKKRVTVNHPACDSIRWNNKTYYQSTVINDTVKSIVFNCDSLITTHNLIINHATVTKQSACANGPFNFYNQVLTAGGHYQHVLQTAAGCDSIIKLYLVITQQQSQNITGCDSVSFGGNWYYASVTRRDTTRSFVSGCDSIINTYNIIVNKTKHSNLFDCGIEGQPYNFNGQQLTTGGFYTSLYPAQPCDSIVHLYLVMTRQKTVDYSACDSLIFNGIIYYSSATVQTKIKSQVSDCDSLIITNNLLINYTKHSNLIACIKQGETYSFNGQNLITAGFYTTRYTTATCDSIVHLQLTVAQINTINTSGCDSVFFNNRYYYSSTQITDTITNNVGCDSLYRVNNIIVSRPAVVNKSVCLQPGEQYFFNGQWLNATGQYSAVYQRPALCDSTIYLSLIAQILETQNLSGCGSVQYNGVTYTASTTLSDTVKSIATNCDSIVRIVNIQVLNNPVLLLSGDATICKGESITLTALATNSSINWTGFGAANAITVKPPSTTNYIVTATHSNGCSTQGKITIIVDELLLTLSAFPNPVLAGKQVVLQTNANINYQVIGWQPSYLFPTQSLKIQQVFADSTTAIMVIGQSASGCRDTADLILAVNPLDDIYVPSGFTPNGDGKNDLLRIIGSGIASLEFYIFNRWGQQVFFTNDKAKGWNGKLAGIQQPGATYVYVVRVKKLNGSVVEKKGTVNLIR